MECWTLAKAGDGWRLESIEQSAEGMHNVESEIVATPWDDERRLRDDAVAERAAADAAPAGFAAAELADLDFDGTARAAALDLALADGRFDPDLIEASVRRAVDAWARGGRRRRRGAGGRRRARTRCAQLLHPGDASGRRGSSSAARGCEAVRIADLDAGAAPPTIAVEVDVTGRRYVEDRDTAAVLSGSRSARAQLHRALDARARRHGRLAVADRRHRRPRGLKSAPRSADPIRVMRSEELALVRGWADTQDTLRRWRARPLAAVGPWVLGSLGVAALLLTATWVVALLSVPDPLVLGPRRRGGWGDFGFILYRNGLVLALHALACVAGFMAGSALPIVAEGYRGWWRAVHDHVGRAAMVFVGAATLFSLTTQAYGLGLQASSLADANGSRPACCWSPCSRTRCPSSARCSCRWPRGCWPRGVRPGTSCWPRRS